MQINKYFAFFGKNVTFCLIVIFINTIPNYLISQQTFKWGFDFDEYCIADYIETSPGNFIFSGAVKKAMPSPQSSLFDSAWIICWNYEGDSISKTFKPEGFSECQYLFSKQCKDGSIIAFGNLNLPNTYDTTGFIAVAYDSLLNQQWSTQLVLPRIGVRPSSATKIPNGNWVVSLNTKNYDWLGAPIDQGYLLELTEEGEILKVVADTVSHIQQVMLHPDSNRFYCLGDYLDIPGIDTYNWLMEYDLELNKIAQKPIFSTNGFFPYCYHGIWIDEDTMLLAAPQNMSGSYWDEDLFLNKMVDGDSIISVQEQRFANEGQDYCQANRSIVITRDNKIVFAATLGPIMEEKAYIGTYNMNLEPLNYRIKTEDGYTSYQKNPVATSDSGFIAYYSKKPNGSNSVDSTFIIKYGKDGPFAGTKDIAYGKKTNHLLYPNPGYNEVHLELTKSIRQKGEVCFELYTLQGIKAGQWNTRETRTLINTSNLPPGVYLYRITRQGKQLASGKWVKQ